MCSPFDTSLIYGCVHFDSPESGRFIQLLFYFIRFSWCMQVSVFICFICAIFCVYCNPFGKQHTIKSNQVLKYSYEQMNHVKGCTNIDITHPPSTSHHTHTFNSLFLSRHASACYSIYHCRYDATDAIAVSVVVTLLNGTYNAKVVCVFFFCFAFFLPLCFFFARDSRWIFLTFIATN